MNEKKFTYPAMIILSRKPNSFDKAEFKSLFVFRHDDSILCDVYMQQSKDSENPDWIHTNQLSYLNVKEHIIYSFYEMQLAKESIKEKEKTQFTNHIATCIKVLIFSYMLVLITNNFTESIIKLFKLFF